MSSLDNSLKVLRINPRAFLNIKKGDKTLEVRRESKFISSLTENEDIILTDNLTDKKSFLKIRISSIRTYDNLADTFKNEDLTQILPHITDISEAIAYYKLLYKTKKDFSIVVLKLLVLE